MSSIRSAAPPTLAPPDGTTRTRPPRAPDPRPARTRAAILHAIERLGASGEEITVAAIVAEAGLSRSSFYSQFKDLGDVAVQLIRGVYERKILPTDSRLRDGGAGEAATLTTTRALFEELQCRRGLYTAVLGGSRSGDAQRGICAIMADGALVTMRRTAPPGIDPEIAASYVAAGMLHTLIDWLLSSSPRSLAEVQRQLVALLPPWVLANTTRSSTLQP